MKLAYSTAAMLLAITTLAACEKKTETTVSTAASDVKAQVENQIEKAGAMIDDATVTAKVKSAFIVDPMVKGLSIDVDTKANVVTLNGAVQSAEARQQAEQIAKTVEGVKEVKNNLTVGQQKGESTSGAAEPSQSMEHLQKAAQRLRESIQAMAQENAGPRRNQAIKEAQQALLQTNQAMTQLPPEMRSGDTPSTTAGQGSTSSGGGKGSAGSSPQDHSASMDRLQKSAQQLRESIQSMAQEAPGARRNDAIKAANRALMDVNQAMVQLPPEMRNEK